MLVDLRSGTQAHRVTRSRGWTLTSSFAMDRPMTPAPMTTTSASSVGRPVVSKPRLPRARPARAEVARIRSMSILIVIDFLGKLSGLGRTLVRGVLGAGDAVVLLMVLG